MSRDWQKDMERVQLGRKMYKTYGAVVEGMDPKESLDEVLIYWLQQYAAERERADKAEEREKVLKHAFIFMLGYVPKTARVALDFDEVLASLCPKEETIE